MRRLILLLILSALTMSCSKKTSIFKKEDFQVYNLILAKEGEIPKLKPTQDNLTYNAKLDSLNLERKQNLSIGIYPYLVNLNKIPKQRIPDDFKFFYNFKDTLIENTVKIPIEKLVSNFKLEIIEDENKFDFKRNPIVLIFSEISFNGSRNKAIVQCSQIRGKLSGGTICYFLEKNDDQWEIVREELLTIS